VADFGSGCLIERPVIRLTFIHIIIIAMEKIAFKIEFVRLIYREKTKKCFRIRLMAQDGGKKALN
jgi:hypothetical protein